jgi:hypothetical protein
MENKIQDSEFVQLILDSVNSEIDQIQKVKEDYANFLINAEKWG